MHPSIRSLATPEKQYVMTMCSSRDAYQVPLALFEVKALRRFVTDFYTPPKLLNSLGAYIPELHKRHHSALPANVVSAPPAAFLYDSVVRAFNMRSSRHWRRIDAWLSHFSRRIAQHNPDAGLLSYHNYAALSFPYLENRPKIIFQYHPHPEYLEQLFARDYARFPEVKWSFENERDSQLSELHSREYLDEWKTADAFICASGVTERSLRYVGCDKPIHVVPYGITPGFEEAGHLEAAKTGDECRFLFVGQGVQRKGLHHLLRAWRLAKLDRSRLELVTSRVDPGIEALLPLPNVHLLGRLSKEELIRRFAAAHVFVMPSLVEGFGLVYLEALAAGCFCLGTANTGLPDLGLDPAKADCVEVGNVEALAERLRELELRWHAGGVSAAEIAGAARIFTLERFRHGIRNAVASIEAGLAPMPIGQSA